VTLTQLNAIEHLAGGHPFYTALCARRLWEAAAKKKVAAEAEAAEIERKAKDPTGMSGNELDLTG